MTCVINASNLHVGGGVQVAASFLHELCEIAPRDLEFETVVSSEVVASLGNIKRLDEVSKSVFRLNVKGFALWNKNLKFILNKHDCVFTIFGPLYRWRAPFVSIVGFAQPWIIYPRNECYFRMTLFEKARTRVRFWIHAQFFKRADILVVELEHVKEGLVRKLGIAPERIQVIHNCISSIFLDRNQWKPLSVPDSGSFLKLGFLGRNYRHKNTDIFPEIVKTLKEAHGIDAKFYVTFTEAEWLACSTEFRSVSINVGKLLPAQCPSFYQAVDAVVFPSLLECFSATPLEALAMEKPLFASDRSFNRDVCGEHAVYFDPLLPRDAAEAIANVFNRGGPSNIDLQAARDHAIAFSSPRERAAQYLELINQFCDPTYRS